MILGFFHRQVYAGSAGTATSYYSETIAVEGVCKLTSELRVFSSNPAIATITALVEHASDPNQVNGWSTLGTLTVNTAAGTGVNSATFSDPLAYVRVRLTIPADCYATVAVTSVARTC
jgi:peptidoglycan hydrolase-like protein with peptidoglycan-binding domain